MRHVELMDSHALVAHEVRNKIQNVNMSWVEEVEEVFWAPTAFSVIEHDGDDGEDHHPLIVCGKEITEGHSGWDNCGKCDGSALNPFKPAKNFQLSSRYSNAYATYNIRTICGTGGPDVKILLLVWTCNVSNGWRRGLRLLRYQKVFERRHNWD